MRPIVSNIGAPTEKVAKWLVKEFQNYDEPEGKSVKNTFDFVEKMKDVRMGPNDLLVSFDVEALFPSIPIDKALLLLDEWLTKHETNAEKRNVYNRAAKFCMENSFCQINNKFYKITEGTSMGNALSPFLANLFMSHFENALAAEGLLPNVWWRYVDDICAIIKNGEEEKLLNVLNSRSPSIKFTIEKEKDGKLPFLDVMLNRSQSELNFSVYRKPTNVPRYIPNDSFCPTSQKHAAFNSMTHRLCNLPLNANNYMTEYNYIKQAAVLNGYDANIIDRMIQRHANMKRRRNATSLTSQTQTQTKRRVCVQFAPVITNQLKRVFDRQNMTLVFSSTNKLKQKLGSTKDKTRKEEKSGIYKIECSDCELVYVGQTRRNITTRFKEHMDLRRAVKSAVSNHIITENHKIEQSGLSLIKHVTNSFQLDAFESLHMRKNADRLMNTMEAPIQSTLFNV